MDWITSGLKLNEKYKYRATEEVIRFLLSGFKDLERWKDERVGWSQVLSFSE
jgi:hypothetical protein